MAKGKYGTTEERLLEKVLGIMRKTDPEIWMGDRIALMRALSRNIAAQENGGTVPPTSLAAAGFVQDLLIEDSYMAYAVENETWWTREQDVDYIFPGLPVAWEARAMLVSLDDAAKNHAAGLLAQDALPEVPLSKLSELMPSCIFADTRDFGLCEKGLNLQIDALFMYPSASASTGRRMLLLIGFDETTGEVLTAQLLLQGSTLRDSVQSTFEEIERLANCAESEGFGLRAILRGESIAYPLVISSTALIQTAAAVLATIGCPSFSTTFEASKNRITLRVEEPQIEPKFEVLPQAEVPLTPENGTAAQGDQNFIPLEIDAARHELSPAGFFNGASLEEIAPSPVMDEAAAAEIEASSTYMALAEAYAAENESLRAALEAAENKNDQLAFHLDQASASVKTQVEAEEAQALRADLFETLELPQTPLEALDLAATAFPDRLIVTEQARKSAAAFVKGNTAEVWSVLRCMATHLYAIAFSEEPGDIAAQFEARCPYSMTMRDTGFTKRNSAIARLRQMEYGGQMVSMAAHVKGHSNKRGETLRVHFFLDKSAKRIVIGHCGEHLETTQTPKI